MERKEQPIPSYELLFPSSSDTMVINGAVNLINQYSDNGLMLPATMVHYTSLAEEGKLVVAKNLAGEVVGTAGYTQKFTKDIWEFGGWAVAPQHQKNGVGMKLICALFAHKPHFKTIAFANANSAPIFKKLGAKLIEDHAALPHAAFDLCATCKNPNKPIAPAVGCCDIIFNLQPIVIKFGMPDISGYSPRQIDRLVYGYGENQSSLFAGFGKEPKDW